MNSASSAALMKMPSHSWLCAPKVNISGTSRPMHSRRLTISRESRSLVRKGSFFMVWPPFREK